jgi:hypothetical protein
VSGFEAIEIAAARENDKHEEEGISVPKFNTPSLPEKRTAVAHHFYPVALFVGSSRPHLPLGSVATLLSKEDC